MRWVLSLAVVLLVVGCDDAPKGSDAVQQEQQERLLGEATSQVGMPAIRNFRERKLLKDILELRDQTGLVTYTYLYVPMTGKLVFLCDSIGYGIPYATQFTNPQKPAYLNPGPKPGAAQWAPLPQADPNGLFSPSNAEGTWIMCKEPSGKDTRPVYVEPRVIVSPFRLGRE